MSDDNVNRAAADALRRFWSGFGVAAFVRGCVPKGYKMPYIEYGVAMPRFLSKSAETARIYVFSEGFGMMDEIVSKVSAAIPEEGVLIRLDNSRGIMRIGRRDGFVSYEGGGDNLVKVCEVEYFLGWYC